MLKLLMVFFTLIFSGNFFRGDEADDDIYEKRIKEIESDVALAYNAEVKQYIEEYLLNKGGETSRMIGLAEHYFPAMEKILKENDVSPDLKYVAAASSNMNTTAVSEYGASGTWQLMYNTATLYQLKINSYVDERRDPLKATKAAAQHLHELNKIYKNWNLSIAAYASTPLNVNKAIRNADGSLKYWEVHPLLPQETRYLMPKFVAAAYILKYYREHMLKSQPPMIFSNPDSAMVDKWLSFEQISSTLNIDIDHLRVLNPIFKKEIIPFSPQAYVILLPKGKGSQFYKLKDSIYKTVSKPIDMSPMTIEKADSIEKAEIANRPPSAVPATVKLIYTVKSGDIMGNVADWFDVSIADIRRWNKLKSNSLIIGKKLFIFVPGKKADYYRKINAMTAKQKRAVQLKD
jgi:membrane-bound lytic murein transglycosylase D